MSNRIAITLSSFAEYDSSSIDILKRRDIKIVRNPFSRKLDRKETLELCNGCIGIIAGTEIYDENMLEQLSIARVISRCGAGLDNVDLSTAKRLGIKVYNTPDAPTLAVAELTVGLIFSLLRNITLMDREVRDGVWKKRMGVLLYGKHVGIISFGRIGKKVGSILKDLGAKVSYYDPFVSKGRTPGFQKVGIEELLKKSDIITLHLPYSKDTHHLLGKAEFAMMKKGVFLINPSRGGIVDEGALYSALKDRRLAGAAIDVFEREPYDGPLKELDNVILTPHIGSYAREARVKMEMEAVKNLIKGLKRC